MIDDSNASESVCQRNAMFRGAIPSLLNTAVAFGHAPSTDSITTKPAHPANEPGCARKDAGINVEFTFNTLVLGLRSRQLKIDGLHSGRFHQFRLEGVLSHSRSFDLTDGTSIKSIDTDMYTHYRCWVHF